MIPASGMICAIDGSQRLRCDTNRMPDGFREVCVVLGSNDEHTWIVDREAGEFAQKWAKINVYTFLS